MSKFTLRPQTPVSSSRRDMWVYGGIATAVLASAFIVWIVFFRTQTSTIPSSDPSTTSNQQSGDDSQTDNNGSTPPPTPPTKQTEPSTPTASTAALQAPSGSFVSNHQPSLSGTDSPSQIQSVCNTTPGATCEIIFEKNNEIKSLGVRTADSEGNSYWNWDVKEASLSTGTWTITARAMLRDQTQTTKDQINLEVKP